VQLATQRLWSIEQTRNYGWYTVDENSIMWLTLSAADTVVKVPQMAESITEGTLKQWSKRAYSYAPRG
jgi:hypothetical protein